MVSKIKYILVALLLLPTLSFAQSTVPQGGTGTTTIPSNYVLLGNTSLRIKAVSTSTLGLESPLTFSSPLSRVANAVSFLFNTINTWTGLNIFNAGASTTVLSVSNGAATTTISGNATSTFGAGISASSLNLTSTAATNTAANGFNILNGCYSVNGTCISSGGTSLVGTTGQVDYFSGTNTAQGTSTIFITTGSVVGINTTNPVGPNANADFTISGKGSVVVIASTTDNQTNSTAILETYAPGVKVYAGSHGASQIPVRFGITLGGWGEIAATSTSGTMNGLILGTVPAAPLVFGTNNVERMRFDSAGFSGIATTAPGSVFSIGNVANFSSATSSIYGNMRIVGNLQVSGNFYSPVQIVSSGNATINGALTVTGATTLATSLTGAVSAASGVLSAGLLSLANGGTNASLSGANQVTFMNSGNTAVTTSANLTFDGTKLTMVAASTTNLSVNGTNIVGTSTPTTSTIAATGAFVMPYATSTTWTGTSSPTVMAVDYVTLPFDLLLTNAVCSDDAGTLNANPTFGVTSIQPQITGISAIPATTTFSSNNALKKGGTFKVVYGTPASSPTSASCTFYYVRQGI